jgi:putative effector of murein hydrolase LrgA (UPF0299 family)
MDNGIGKTIWGAFILALVLLCVLVWLGARYCRTVSQAWSADLTNKLFWIPAVIGALTATAGIALNGNPALLTLAALSFSFLWLASYTANIRAHQRFERPFDITSMYHPNTWWQEA